MNRFRILGVALVAVFAIGVVVVSSASATVTFLLANWLVNGVEVTTELSVESSGELTLLDSAAPILGEAIVDCSGIFDGTINLNGADEFLELLNLLTELINLTPLVELGLECENLLNCPSPLVWAINLPWPTDMELMEEGTEAFFVDLILMKGEANPGWLVACMGIIGEPEDECTALEGIIKLTNEANGTIHGQFEEAFTELAGLKLATCAGGLESGVVEGLGFTSIAGGGLSVSSE